MRPYTIYPVKGEEAKRYLQALGCSVDTELLSIPDHLVVTPTDNGSTYAVMGGGATVFCMQYYPSNYWRIVVPVSYRISFSELIRSYSLNDVVAARLLGDYGIMLQMMGGAPVHRSVAMAALKRLSDHTGHPYDLENVKVVLAQGEV
jgi:hypothetical protein